MLDEGKVITVRGPIDPEEIGVCTMHEHVLFNFLGMYSEEPTDPEEIELANSRIDLSNRGLLYRNPSLIRENLYNDSVETSIRELTYFERAGGQTLVEATPIGHARDVEGLKRISEETGVNIIANSAFYVEVGHPDYVPEKSIDELAGVLIKEITEGVDGTGIRAGFMNDVGTSGEITENERKCLRAAARAHLATGAGISVHLDPREKSALTAINILLEEGVKPHRIVMEHLDEQPDTDYHLAIAETGVYLELDTWSAEFYYGPPYWFPEPRDTQRAQSVKFLVDRGYVNQILLGQDIWIKMMMRQYGGEGYASLLRNGVPIMKKAGITDEQIKTMLVENPQRVLPLSL